MSTVLVADDSLVIRAVVRRHLEAEGYSVVEAEDGNAAIAACRAALPDAVLLDIEMPGLSGHEVLAQLKAEETLRDVPVVFLTGRTGTDDIVAGLRCGAHDYLKKPFEPAELIARVGAAVRTKVLQDRLRTQSAEFDRVSRTDALTGLYNRRHLQEQLRQLGGAAVRHDRSLAVVMFDVDFFKKVNDSAGHQGGDDVLNELAHRIQSAKREEDVAGRWGGEEFLLILPECDVEAAYRVGERIRETVAATPFPVGAHQLPVTVSGGCAAGRGDDIEAMVDRADKALYVAKEAGRNLIVADGCPVVPAVAVLGSAAP